MARSCSKRRCPRQRKPRATSKRRQRCPRKSRRYAPHQIVGLRYAALSPARPPFLLLCHVLLYWAVSCAQQQRARKCRRTGPLLTPLRCPGRVASQIEMIHKSFDTEAHAIEYYWRFWGMNINGPMPVTVMADVTKTIETVGETPHLFYWDPTLLAYPITPVPEVAKGKYMLYTFRTGKTFVMLTLTAQPNNFAYDVTPTMMMGCVFGPARAAPPPLPGINMVLPPRRGKGKATSCTQWLTHTLVLCMCLLPAHGRLAELARAKIAAFSPHLGLTLLRSCATFLTRGASACTHNTRPAPSGTL